MHRIGYSDEPWSIKGKWEDKYMKGRIINEKVKRIMILRS